MNNYIYTLGAFVLGYASTMMIGQHINPYFDWSAVVQGILMTGMYHAGSGNISKLFGGRN